MRARGGGALVGLSTRAARPPCAAKHATAAGLPEHLHAPHVLRHTFCTRLAEDEQPLDVIRDLARHRDIRITQRYIHVTDTRRQNAIDETFRAGRGVL